MLRVTDMPPNESINQQAYSSDIPSVATAPQEHAESMELSVTTDMDIDSQHTIAQQLFTNNLCIDALLQIFSHLDPLSLSCIMLTSQFLRSIAISDQLWKMHSLRHFLIAVTNPVNVTPSGMHRFFITTSNEYYPGFSHQEKECFTLVRANDLHSIMERKIDFTIEILNKPDSKDNSLLSLIRKQNNRRLNEYIFKQLRQKEFYYLKIDLIHCALQLDQADEYFEELLNEQGNIDEISIENASLLYMAVVNNSIHSAELLLKLKADPNLTNGELPCPLYLAAQEGRLEMVNLLLSNGAHVNALYKGEFSAIYIAAQKGHLEVVQCLVRRGANINIQVGENNGFPLYIAMQEKHTAVVIFLLEQKANIKLKYAGFSPLYIGTNKNHLDGVKALLVHCKKNSINPDINKSDGDGSTPLYLAVQDGHADMVQLLLESGANIECEFLGGYTPLYVAAQNGHLKVIEILCQYKPNYNRLSPNGSTALYVAAQNGHMEVVSLLCKQAACNIGTVFSDGYTPLYVACQKGFLPIVKMLLEHGANINYQTRKKATPLYAAAQKGFKDVVAVLLESGANPNLRFKNGYTPLHILCNEFDDYNICMPIITLLIRAGAEPLSLDLRARTPAMLTNNARIQNILLSLERLAAQDMSQLVSISPNHATDTRSIINVINDFITDERKRSSGSSGLKIQAKLCLDLLMDTSTFFACAVVLYSLLDKSEHNQTAHYIFNSDATKFIQCITNVLGFSSKLAAKNSLYSMIFASLANDKELLNELNELLIQPLILGFNSNAELTPDSYHTIMLCLNLFEAKIKQSYQLTVSLEQEKQRVTKMNL